MLGGGPARALVVRGLLARWSTRQSCGTAGPSVDAT
jgi:hypothetical protein